MSLSRGRSAANRTGCKALDHLQGYGVCSVVFLHGKHPRERTISATLKQSIGRIRRRARLVEALRVGIPTAALAAFAWISVRFGVAFGLDSRVLSAASVILPFAVVFRIASRAFAAQFSDDLVVRELDSRAGASGRLIAAFELAPLAASNSFAAAALADAQASIASAAEKARSFFPLRFPAETSRALVLVALVPLTVLALRGAAFDLTFEHAPKVPPADAFEAHGKDLANVAEKLNLPTMAWAIQEARRILEPLRVQPTPTPVKVALGPTPVPTRGSTITDPKAREFFDQVLSGATSQSVGKEINERFTGEMATTAFKILEAEFKTSGSTSSKYSLGADAGGAKDMKLPKDAGGGSGGMAPEFDPSTAKAEYLKDKDQGKELMSALHESFEAYLKEFAAEMLKGMEDALEQRLGGGNGKGDGVGKAPMKGMPDNPKGLAEERDAHGSSSDGPMFKAKTGGKPDASMEAKGQMALGGTAAGGTGAGAGDPGAQQTSGGDASGVATGEKIELGGTLDEKLAVIEVIRRMSGGSEAVEDSSSAEVVLKTTKAAEAEAADAEEVPEEYRAAVERYFHGLAAPLKSKQLIAPVGLDGAPPRAPVQEKRKDMP